MILQIFSSRQSLRLPFFEFQNSQNRVAKTFQYFTFGSPGNETRLPYKSGLAGIVFGFCSCV
jgi:hypothetical protein